MTKMFTRIAIIFVSVLTVFSVSITAAHAASKGDVGSTWSHPGNPAKKCHFEVFVYTTTDDNGVPVVYAFAETICNARSVGLTSEAKVGSDLESEGCANASYCASQAGVRNPAGSQQFCGIATGAMSGYIPPASTTASACINA